MRTKLYTVLALLLLVFTTSCNFTENITINPDGSGNMIMAMDGSALMALAGEEIAGETGGKRTDTIMDFGALLKDKKDSITKMPEQEKRMLQALSNMKIKMLMDPETSEFKFDMISDFKKIDELQDMMKLINEARNMDKNGLGAAAGMMNNNSVVKYSYDGKKFIRKVELPETFQKLPDSLNAYMEMMGASEYVLKYKFPKKIKSVSDKKAVIGQDGKSLTLTYSFSDYLSDPKKMGLEVEFVK